MTIAEAQDIIKRSLPEEEILAQLAEEAAELAQAALKLRRVLDGGNPTPVTEEKARENFLEECGDVLNCIDLLLPESAPDIWFNLWSRKYIRWAERLLAKEPAL